MEMHRRKGRTTVAGNSLSDKPGQQVQGQDSVNSKQMAQARDTKDFHGFNTGRSRQALDLDVDKDKRHGTPRAIVPPFNLKLTTLTKDMELFKSAFVRLVCCHAILWIRGIQHGDISTGNLMCGEEDSVPKLCDHDLSHLDWEKQSMGRSNAGTLRFMATGLLTEASPNTGRVYRHDAESFAWTLLWSLGRYRNGQRLDDAQGRQLGKDQIR